jgi:hypothetical protein
MMTGLTIRPGPGTRYDLVSLGEVMLRLDPGEGRIRNSRSFTAWEGGGEYYSDEAIRTVRDFAAHEVARVLTGQPPLSPVNAAQLAIQMHAG